jgi:hypothetical protein
MIDNIIRQDVENVMQQTIDNFNNNTDNKEYIFNVWIEDELVDILKLPANLATIYRNSPVFVEVTGNAIFE